MKNFAFCLRPTEAIDLNYEATKRVAEKLNSHYAEEIEKVMRAYYFVRDAIQYNFYIVSVTLEDFTTSAVLTRGKGCCVQKVVLLAAQPGRAVGTPSKLAFGRIRSHRLPAHLMVAGTALISHLFLAGLHRCYYDRRQWRVLTYFGTAPASLGTGLGLGYRHQWRCHTYWSVN